eukprot:TRINITY_DN9760_c0_g3_i1.p1 TRINITY_DN9760_c0_g3~~TRINITY_DN9760_c0_g3_i1.p1  ORF type:complete len:103 (-),score=8.30 TRINITY_DN9760_c0_g3_i1:7-315(-)
MMHATCSGINEKITVKTTNPNPVQYLKQIQHHNNNPQIQTDFAMQTCNNILAIQQNIVTKKLGVQTKNFDFNEDFAESNRSNATKLLVTTECTLFKNIKYIF